MVVFTCNNCGESLKKNVVDKHIYKCRGNIINVCCMDCLKDFNKDTYSGHTQCVTELERYSGKDYVPKANQNKGQKKQEAWVDLVRAITEKKTNLSNGVKKILETISSYDNIPRKKAKFLNFMRNSFRYMKNNELEEAWTLLEEAMKDSKAEHTNGQQNGANNGVSKGADQLKRKLETDDTETAEEPSIKKIKSQVSNEVEEEQPETVSSDKFRWSETIRNILSAKNNELKLKKLRKKVLNQYQSLTGSEWSDKVENKFNKKINKFKGLVVDNEKVRLVE